MTSPGRTVADAPTTRSRTAAPPARRPAPRRPPSRVRRRHEQRVYRRRRAAVLGLIVLLALAGVATGVGPDLVRKGFRSLVPSTPGATVVDEPESLLLAWSTAGDDGAAGVLLGVDPDAEDAAGMLLPGFAQLEVPSLGSRTLAETVEAGSAPLSLAIENVLGVEVSRVVTLDADDLAATFEPFAPFEVRLREPLLVEERRFRSGTQAIGADDAVRLMTVRAEGASDLDHLVTVQAVVEGWLAQLRGDAAPLAADRLGDAAGLDGDAERELTAVLAEFAGRRVVFDSLDVTSLGFAGGERYTVDHDAVEREVAAVFPSLLHAPGDRIDVEIRNGVGRAALATAVAHRVIPVGARVVLTGNAAEFGLEQTFVVVREAEFADEAERLIDALGVGDLRQSDDVVGAADIVIVVGQDFDPGGA